ncbi:MAG: single-stranded-DNA-specific exonuclease RecJ [Clostridia bacterium]|nr:single-stranded-DNA-specific exonuclease RecJ [Clostridia bacterium]
MNKRWNILYNDIDKATAHALANTLHVSPLLALIMLVRGIAPAEAADFLTGGIAGLHDPFSMKDMDKACARIQAAIQNGEKITVYGDYDVDGISSVAMLLLYLQKQHALCDFYIPDRQKEGYGLNGDAIQKIAAEGTTLIITVDTGITACAEVELAKSMGVDVVITDHHSVPSVLPQAIAVVNPHRQDCPYPYKSLAGGGVAFKLISALCQDAKAAVTDYVDIAALATIADVVPLTGENRVIAALGLRKMRKMPATGIAALIEVSGLSQDTLSAYQIGFSVAPRINAAGRMGDCSPAVRLLLTDNYHEAIEISSALDAQNAERKAIGDAIFKDAVATIEAGDYAHKKVLVLQHDHWHHGIIGIIASKITEKYYKSTILISTDGDTAKGSGRSIPGFNLFEALSACSDALLRFGGHALAAGLTLDTAEIPNLDAKINAFADEVLSEEDMCPVLSIDAPLPLSGSLLAIAADIEKLEPFGAGNSYPMFLLEKVTITGVRTSKDEKHLFLRLWGNGASVDAVFFGQGALKSIYARGDIVDVAGELHINTYGGGRTPQIIIADMKKQ